MIISRPVWRRFPDLPAIIQFTDVGDVALDPVDLPPLLS